MVWRALCALLALAALAACAPAASAQGDRVRSFADTRAVPSPDEARFELQAMRRSVCPRGRPRSGGRRLRKARAVARAQRLLRRRVGGRRYARFLRSRRARRAAVAEDFAATALAARSPGAALAGFLAAHRREPRNPRHLLNASVMLVRVGSAAEALALVSAAQRLRPPRRAPMGIGVRALALNNRGFALIALRRYREAEQSLRSAIRREPLLAEARLNLAVARLCAGRVGHAVEPYIAGRRRNAFTDNVSAARAQARAGDALDMSFGVDGKLPNVRIPQTSQDAAASAPAFESSYQSWIQRTDAQYQTATAAIAGGLTGLTNVLSLSRAGEIVDLWNQMESQRPDIRAIRERLEAMKPRLEQNYGDWSNERDQIFADCIDQGGTSEQVEMCQEDRCIPATQSAHTRWVQLIREADGHSRDLAREVHRYATALAANLSSPGPRAALVEASRHLIYVKHFSFVVADLALWTGALDTLRENCVESGGEPQGEEGEPDLGPGFACPPELKGIKFSFKLPPFFSIGVNCEAISVEASEGPVGPFAQVNYRFASGSTTVFAGAKAGGSITGIGGGAKAGIYMSFDSAGNMTDTGLRLTGAVSGPSFPGFGDAAPQLSGTLDYSLAGSFL